MASQRPANTFGLQLTNHHVVKAVLDNIKPNKAQGHDLIPPWAVKASSGSLAKPFSDLVNTIIAKSQVPDSWKHGQITPHHKKESVLDKNNFRLVTVLPRLRVVPLSLGPSCVTRTKTARKKWSREIMGARSTRASRPQDFRRPFFSHD